MLKSLMLAAAIVTGSAAAYAQETTAKVDPTPCEMKPTSSKSKDNVNYWAYCKSDCPAGTLVISGSCYAEDTRGTGIAVESFGISENAWYCNYVDARNIGTGTPIHQEAKLFAKAICLGRY